MSKLLLAIDQGTTNSRAVIFDVDGRVLSAKDMPFSQSFPANGWVEQDPAEMVAHSVACCREALNNLHADAGEIAGIGISSQRETTIIWDRMTGQPVYPAIVWQDRRTADLCRKIAATPLLNDIRKKTGLLADSYFSATKIVWILDNVPGVRERAERGELAFGTVDTYLIWILTGGKSHVTDATNASRTMLFNILTQQWDSELLRAFNIPATLLPAVLDCCADFGETDSAFFGKKIRIAGVAGDQQAALVGQSCFQPGMIKVTYGTGAFVLLNSGKKVIYSDHGLLSTVAYRLNGAVTYGLEGSIFCAGTIIKWLRDTLKLISTATETEQLAAGLTDTGGVYLVPAFTGLGAPYWCPEARGTFVGLTLASGKAHIVRAALEAVVYQTCDLLNAMGGDSALQNQTIRVDGGMAANNWLLQFLSDMLNLTVQRPVSTETSALGVAFLAGLQVGVYDSPEKIASMWKMNGEFLPVMSAEQRASLYAGWQRAVRQAVCV